MTKSRADDQMDESDEDAAAGESLDQALRAYRESFASRSLSAARLRRILDELPLSQSGDAHADAELTRFASLIQSDASLRSRITASGPMAQLVRAVQTIAREHGIALTLSSVYALFGPAQRTASGELSDEDLAAVSAGSRPTGFQPPFAVDFDPMRLDDPVRIVVDRKP